ncbi:PAS domain S-box protein [Halomonas sp. SH5A2]|uniref:PAS domain-containing protein n=1 Tax=Halomonas sp. SH5A2 TaxID=2749040 RepID=UPI0016415B1C|nr:PAS domain-containing protein [Halomonas sp. SH5A2]QNI02797.1 PAS domain S-box protein [Halomonas sp. SH5A2]
MPTSSVEATTHAKLRDKAIAQLQAGTTPPSGHWSLGVDTLRLLHQLSSNPDKANDALKLLHELQVHQVELDLQNEELATNEQALVEDINLYRALYDAAPLAYFVVDFEGVIIKANFIASELFGIGQDHLVGKRIDTFLKAQDRQSLLDLLQHVAQSGAKHSCVTERDGATQDSRHLTFQADLSPSSPDQLLLACYECACED